MKLYLIPSLLGDEATVHQSLPLYNLEVLNGLKIFVVEDLRSARRFIKKCNPQADIDSLTFFLLNEHSSEKDLMELKAVLKQKNEIGLISEAGLPCVADPGSQLVQLAHVENYEIIPLIGPGSIYLALMASGFNGQNFAFNGYLPLEKKQRQEAIKNYENLAKKNKQTQIFIETPYRNNQLLEEILNTCKLETSVCIAHSISLPQQFIKTKTVLDWLKQKPELNKKPCIFLIYDTGNVKLN